MEKNKKKLLLIITFSILACSLVSCLYLSARFVLLNRGYSLSDIIFNINKPENRLSEESAEILTSVAIPGITQEKLRQDLSTAGFECNQPEISENELYRWVCWMDKKDSSYQEIFIFSRNLDEVDFIDMNITQFGTPSDQVCSDYFDSIVVLIDDSRHFKAVQAWISQTLPEIDEIRELQEANFGGIHYRLYGLPQTRSLEIGILP